VILGKDSVVLPNTHINGGCVVGERTILGPNSVMREVEIGNDCKIVNSFIEESILNNKVSIGPFSHIRPGCILNDNVYIGNYVETKNSHIGENTKIGHFGYIGDSQVGKNVNIGAGTITCNYDGEQKHITIINDGAFIGSDTMLVAPINIGKNVVTGAGSVITSDVPDNSKVIGAPARIVNNRSEI
jgi:bifunctional UDP-N-acetylglucosamine pyrophosphorylase/glucosamine-1-phosphate N-acetyltransferase